MKQLAVYKSFHICAYMRERESKYIHFRFVYTYTKQRVVFILYKVIILSNILSHDISAHHALTRVCNQFVSDN